MNNKKIDIRDIVSIGIFAALVTIATTIRIPLPALVGAPFVHFGSSVFILSVLLLGYWQGALAGGIGFALFDVLNGFAIEAPYFILECFIVGGAVYGAFNLLKHQQNKFLKLFIPALVGGIAKLAMTFLKNLVMSLYLGSSFGVAVTNSISTLYITLLNAIAAIVIVLIAYYPLKKILAASIFKNK